ncbi:S-adenosylmethionine decarboxylase [Polyangium jinanense]|uniref:S-adenosylmethionine decarboxylase n=2 Tax=Polyangium jinanense TaxID=2829994 RepID=A0A9X4AUK9_9BACT|nr:S-adenosylmethionine decarboxylase [Polyangium jinanense]MDC3985373.1 S-adenosylmethionine decarboxylase [Polyangium jinanense]
MCLGRRYVPKPPMKLFVLLAILTDCRRDTLDSPDALRAALDAAVAAGPFTGLGTLVVPFSPQGVTACAVVGESHIALHTWPEEGRLFVDVASCSTKESVERALDAIRAVFPEGKLAVLDERVLDGGVISSVAR